MTDIVLGATEADQINYGETIRRELVWKDDAGNALDLSGATITVFQSWPALIKTKARVTITDAAAGKIEFHLGRDDAVGLPIGRVSGFRLRAIFGPESDDVTPPILIQVT